MLNVNVDQRILEACPQLKIGLIKATVVNADTCDALWDELLAEADAVKRTYELLAINQRPAVAATRRLYKSLGKDPGRYRVASEALCRRIIRDLGLYRLTALIDIVNLVSVKSGYPISGLDFDKIVGHTLTLGVGEAGEVYNGIGRGMLNIEGMPVYRDALGGIATPTSDEERTKFTLDTKTVQININGFGPEMDMDETVALTVQLLKKYAQATDIETTILTF
ncbi:MAG: phenylalanine--tRNA ligase beta subunit-related protein [Bacteroidales bacterium]|nr:phenylalanine--tRNA ligase beta subunit-related protein [Bacteroidales bacterium]